MLAVAYEYTLGGVSYQVGEFASDLTDASKALFVKSLRNTSSAPFQYNWRLMMKNVYYLASTVQKEKSRRYRRRSSVWTSSTRVIRRVSI